MAVSFVGSATASETAGGNPVIDLSGLGLQEGDVVYVGGVAVNGSFAGVAGVSTTGFDPVATSAIVGVAGGFAVERKVMGASPDSSVTCVGSGTSNPGSTSYVAMAFRGVDTTTPEDVSATTATNSGSATDPASVDPTTDDCGVAVFGGFFSGADDSPSAAPSGYGGLDSVSANDGNSNVNGAYAAWKLLSGNAAEDPGAFTQASTFWAAATIALRPAAGGGGGGIPKPVALYHARHHNRAA